MRSVIGLTLIVMIGFAAWEVGGSMSSDAVAMAVGVLLGVLAGVPMALLLLAGNRRQPDRSERTAYDENALSPAYGRNQWAGAPPVIVVTGAPGANQASAQLPEPASWTVPTGGQMSQPARRFKVVGEREEWIDEW
jgi:hypothetical protein